MTRAELRALQRLSYELRCTGMGWGEIAERTSTGYRTAISRAMQHAITHRKAWPIDVPPAPRTPDEAARRRHRIAHTLRGCGWTWAEIAQRTGYAHPSGAANAAATHAQRTKEAP